MIPKKITKELKDFICEGFLIIKKSDYEYKQKVDLLGSLFSLGAGTGWRPREITLGALKLFIKNDFKLPKGLNRAHTYHRRETMRELLEKEWVDDSWWDWYKERDYTVLATRAENSDEKNFHKLLTFEIPLTMNLFSGKRVGFEYRDEEREFLKKLAKKQGLI